MSQIFNKAILLQTKLNNNLLTANNLLKAAKNFVNTSEQEQDRSKNTSMPLVKSDQKTNYLNSKLIDFNPGWNNLNILSLCQRAQDSLYVNSKSGVFTCLNCDKTGDWNQFKKLAENILDEDKKCSEKEEEDNEETEKKKPIKQIKFRQAWTQTKPIRDLNDSQFKILVRNSGLTDELAKSIFEAYDIRILEQDIMAPVMNYRSQLQDIILLNSKDRNETLKPNQIFGLNNLPSKANTELYITDHVLNLLALKQELKKPVIVIDSIEALNDQVILI